MLANGPVWTRTGRVLGRLEQVRVDGVLEQHRHRAGGLQIFGRDRAPIAGVADGDRAEPPPQLEDVAREAQDRHHL